MPFVSRLPGIDLAYEFCDGTGPVLMFCAGYGSDMTGSKALALAAWCQANGRAMLRFDYAGHGASGGLFVDNHIGDWAADAAFILDQLAPGRELILVGSSMGGWIALLLGRALTPRLRGLVLVAPAPDFTELLLKEELNPAQWAVLEEKGMVYQPSDYGEPLPFSLKLIRGSQAHLVLNAPLDITCPVRILHGMADADVPWKLSLRLTETLASQDVRLVYVKDGDHRLSRPQDLSLLCDAVADLFLENGG